MNGNLGIQGTLSKHIELFVDKLKQMHCREKLYVTRNIMLIYVLFSTINFHEVRDIIRLKCEII